MKSYFFSIFIYMKFFSDQEVLHLLLHLLVIVNRRILMNRLLGYWIIGWQLTVLLQVAMEEVAGNRVEMTMMMMMTMMMLWRVGFNLLILLLRIRINAMGIEFCIKFVSSWTWNKLTNIFKKFLKIYWFFFENISQFPNFSIVILIFNISS